MYKNKQYEKLSEESKLKYCIDGHNCPPPIEALNGRVMVLEAKNDIIFDKIKTLDKRLWFVLATIIIGFLATITLSVFHV